MKKVKVAVLISGRGSNLKALINACRDENFPAEISLVISNIENAGGLEFAHANNIKTAFVNHKSFKNREDFDLELDKIIRQNNCQIICLAGFMRILSADFTKKWEGKMINIHPSLLPAFKGGNAVFDALNYGVKFSGCTVHFVSPEIDSGAIISQEIVPVLESDSKETLASRILEKEHLIYPLALKKVAEAIIKYQ